VIVEKDEVDDDNGDASETLRAELKQASSSIANIEVQSSVTEAPSETGSASRLLLATAALAAAMIAL
jgi:hypothetical protein